jgi:hypothetical protein
MVSYPSEAGRDSGHDRFIESLNRDLCARMFESHARDLYRAAQRYLNGALDADALVTLMLRGLKDLNYYAPRGVLNRALAAYRRAGEGLSNRLPVYTNEAFDVALDRMIARDLGDDEDADGGVAVDSDAGGPESDASGAAKEECKAPQSNSGTPFANSSFESEAK